MLETSTAAAAVVENSGCTHQFVAGAGTALTPRALTAPPAAAPIPPQPLLDMPGVVYHDPLGSQTLSRGFFTAEM